MNMFWSNVAVSLFIIVISFLFKQFRPKEINSVVGYRTGRSMSSQHAWDFANKYSSELLFKFSLGVVAFQVIAMFVVALATALNVTLILWVIMLISTIIITEMKLKKEIEDNDNK
jgi:uncharacterized membrane protein